VLLSNWLPTAQKFFVTVNLTEKPSPAVFVSLSDVVEMGPNGSKDFPIRFMSYVEGVTRGSLTFTNIATGDLMLKICIIRFVTSSVLVQFY
jgi:hypothetical protein